LKLCEFCRKLGRIACSACFALSIATSGDGEKPVELHIVRPPTQIVVFASGGGSTSVTATTGMGYTSTR
jgi:hypothetical protein